jgi:ABC-2 type transport system ATP-binding protein
MKSQLDVDHHRSELAIEIRRLIKTFDGARALDGADLTVRHGAVFGLIGRNGAGKTTLIRTLLGLLRPDSGEARLLGHDFRRAPREIRSRIAYVGQAQHLHPWMSLAEHAQYLMFLYERWSNGLAAQLMRRFGLDPERPIGQLSGGQQRLAAITLALAAQPDLLVLDEPATGLDPIARRQLIEHLVDFLHETEGQRTVLLSTHLLHDVERIADHIGIMDRGRVLAAGSLEEFQMRTRRVQMVFDTVPPSEFAIPGALRIRREGAVLTAVCRADAHALEQVQQTPGARVNIFPLGLEELFIELLDGAAFEGQECETAV